MADALVDRKLLEKLERLSLSWLNCYPGVLGGHNRSRLPGYGQEFLDHRNFYPGDDLRLVNWRAYLRFERFLLKTFELEPRVPIRLLLDASLSMQIGDKFDYARKLALALIYIALVKLDSVTLQPFTDRLLRPIQASGGRQRIHVAEAFLRSLHPESRTDFPAVVRAFLSAYRKPGLVLVLSDFLGEPDALAPLQRLSDAGHELLLVQVWGWADRHPAYSGTMDLIDSELGTRRRVHVDSETLKAYAARTEEHSENLRRMAARSGGRFVDICTRVPVEEALFGRMREVIERS